MDEQTLSLPLEGRVRRLERVNRRLMVGIFAVSSLLLLGAARNRAQPEIVRVRGLEVVDESGRMQARITTSAEGAEMQLLDAGGVARASLGHGAEGTALYIRDGEGTTRIGVSQFAHGGGGFALHGEGARGAAVLYLKAAKGALTFYGEDGNVLSRVPAPQP